MGAPRQRPRFETRVIPRTTEIDSVEALLDNALFAVVGGLRSVTTPAQVHATLSRHYQVAVQVRRYHAEAFLLVFQDRQEADRVLHTNPPEGADLRLVLRRWQRQSGALFKPMFFKILLSIENILAHI
jgi:hypothetical protein